jgi:hypothetical protein
MDQKLCATFTAEGIQAPREKPHCVQPYAAFLSLSLSLSLCLSLCHGSTALVGLGLLDEVTRLDIHTLGRTTLDE